MPKFRITKSRYVEGQGLVFASADRPAIIELDKAPSKERDEKGNLLRANEWRHLHEIDDDLEPPKPHYVKNEQRRKESAAGVFAKRTSDREAV